MPHAFKDLIIHEIPQFILHIAVRYVLHHYSSQDIHHCKILEDYEISEESFVKCRKKGFEKTLFKTSPVTVALDAKIMIDCLEQCVRMILPQVHLRKPCYDFSFL